MFSFEYETIDAPIKNKKKYTQGFAVNNAVVGTQVAASKTRGKVLFVVVHKPLGGGQSMAWTEEPPEKHPFELIQTERIIVSPKEQGIDVKVILEELSVNAEIEFKQFSEIVIVFQGFI